MAPWEWFLLPSLMIVIQSLGLAWWKEGTDS